MAFMKDAMSENETEDIGPAPTQQTETGPDVEAMAPTEEEGEEQSNVSPEEQQDYDAMTAMALDMVYGEDYLPNVLNALSASKGGLAESIGMLGANVMKAAIGAFKEKGKEPDPEMVLQVAANELIPSLVELAIQSGKAKESDAPALIRDALFAGMEQYGNREFAEGTISPEAQAEAQQSQGQIMAGLPGFRPNRKQRRAMKFGKGSIGGRA